MHDDQNIHPTLLWSCFRMISVCGHSVLGPGVTQFQNFINQDGWHCLIAKMSAFTSDPPVVFVFALLLFKSCWTSSVGSWRRSISIFLNSTWRTPFRVSVGQIYIKLSHDIGSAKRSNECCQWWPYILHTVPDYPEDKKVRWSWLAREAFHWPCSI